MAFSRRQSAVSMSSAIGAMISESTCVYPSCLGSNAISNPRVQTTGGLHNVPATQAKSPTATL